MMHKVMKKKGTRKKSALVRSSRRSDGKQKIEKKEEVVLPQLDNDVLANIFVRIPADLLHKKIRYQCKQWFNILNDANFIHSKTGIIFPDQQCDEEDTTYTGMRLMEFEGGLELKIRELSRFPAKLRIISSCNGLVLAREGMEYPPALVILNPSTKENIRVPPCTHKCLWHDLVYVPTTKEYKLVDMFRPIEGEAFHTRSIGGGGWDVGSYCYTDFLRLISVQSSYCSMEANCRWNERISIDGILYMNSGSYTKIVSFNPCDGQVRILQLPGSRGVRLIELGGLLSCVRSAECEDYGKHSPTDVWVLKDINKGEWEKKFSIADLPKSFAPHWYNVAGSLNNGKILVFASRDQILRYDVESKQTTIFQGERERSNLLGGYCVHVNNLASIK